ncbi:sulfatase-like hydrolase/transferase [Planctomycetota bacterium]
MKKHFTHLLIFLLLSMLSYDVDGKSTEVRGTTPNIVFILADDQGYGDLSCYGSTTIKTPHIDSLCEQGMKFESFYVHNRCSPTRAAFMTGCHAQRVDIGKVIYYRDQSGLNSNEITIAELLQQAGYATGIIGKWHLGEWPRFNPVHHGFDYFFGYFDDNGKGRAIFENTKKVADVDKKNDRFSSKAFLPAGLKFIRKHKDQPFFLYYASNIPHAKWLPHADFKGTSQQGAYGDCVQQLDWEFGELLKEFDSLGLTENTLVIYASDNGPQLNQEGHGSTGVLRDGKWTNFEGGIRVPCLMRWPGKIPAGSTNYEIAGIMDMLPTFCELAGLKVPTDRIIDGKSILPYMLGQNLDKPIHETFIVPGATIRHGDWKLLVKDQKPGGGGNKGKQGRMPAKAGSLFNLRDDLGETKDFSAVYPETVVRLSKMMEAYMETFSKNIRPREPVTEK